MPEVRDVWDQAADERDRLERAVLAEPPALPEHQRLSRLLWDARESIDMLADIIEFQSGEPDTADRELIAEIDSYRAERGWSPNGYGGESS